MGIFQGGKIVEYNINMIVRSSDTTRIREHQPIDWDRAINKIKKLVDDESIIKIELSVDDCPVMLINRGWKDNPVDLLQRAINRQKYLEKSQISDLIEIFEDIKH